MTPRHTWSHPAALDEETLLRDCSFAQGRSGGPGGQHRNKVETKVTATHTPTGLSASASERRSAIENKRVAIKRLRLTLATEFRAGVPAGEIGSDLWKSRRKKQKQGPQSRKKKAPLTPETVGLHAPAPQGSTGMIVCNPSHRDYPALLAEALDVLADAGWDHDIAATRLDVSKTQLVKLIREHAPALVLFNKERVKAGLRALR